MSEEHQPNPEEQPTPQPQPEEPQPAPQPEEPQQQPAAQVHDWRDRRIGEQQQRLRERAARISELEAQLAQYQNPQNYQQSPQGHAQSYPPQQGNQTQYSAPQYQPQPPGDLQRQINEAAAQMAQQNEFTRRCNETAESGRRAFGQQAFDQRVQRLTSLVDAGDNEQRDRYNGFLMAALETGDGARLIYDLGGDLNEASRIMSLPPMRMAVELTKMANRASTTDASHAPRPINPVATAAQNNRVAISPDNPDSADALSIEDWMRMRDEQINSRRQRNLG